MHQSRLPAEFLRLPAQKQDAFLHG
jgi:hypothetical protein